MRAKVFLLWIIVLGFVCPALSMLNPAAVYCKALGYEYKIEKTELGEKGFCILPDNRKVDEWDFFYCREGKEYSYCKKVGLEAKSREEGCFCVLKNGTEIEVTKLMNLSFEETVCGDGICAFPENYGNCPQDCPSGSYDGYCDGVRDGKCDPDCKERNLSEKDPDCVSKPLCGNGICEPGENQKNCCRDCGCPSGKECVNNVCVSKCGNGRCELGENFGNCPKDCPSGGKDGYCDRVKDGKCDPDCERKEDKDCWCNRNGICEPEYEDYLTCPEDCKRPGYQILLILIPIIIIIAGLLYFIYSKSERI